MQALLPEQLESVTLKDMLDGESFYIMPWGMYADNDGRMWLNGNYPISGEEKGTLKLLVTKRHGAYIVDVSMCKNEKWSRGEPSFVGDFTPLPVAEIAEL